MKNSYQHIRQDTAVEISSKDLYLPRYGSILIVTYGRSGSTLLQGVLNSLPSVLVRGENHDFCWGLYTAWKSLVAAKMKYGHPNSASATDAWYGAMDLNPELFIERARPILKAQLIPESHPQNICWGFKEIRYLEHLDELPAFLDFLSALLPHPAIIFNTRDHDAVCKSAFWKRFPQQDLRKKLTLADRTFFEYAERNDHAFICRYERLVLGYQALRPLFEFMGAFPDPEVLISVLQSPHSFVPKSNTLKTTAQIRKTRSEHIDLEIFDDHPCVPDMPIKDHKPSGKVVVFCIVRDEIVRLPWFLKYYRSLGCREFVFIDTGSQDGTLEFLKAQTDSFLYRAPRGELRSSRSGSEWVNALGPKHAMHRWILLADIDEILALPEEEREGLAGLANRAERLGLNRVFTPMIDIYPEKPCDTLPDYEPGQAFVELAWLMDDVVHIKGILDKGRLILYSGPRARYAEPGKRPPIMSKQNFYYVEPEGYLHIGPHFDTYARPSPLVVPFLHFKFLPDFKKRMEKSISEGVHWNNSVEYRGYASAQLSARTLAFEGSVDFRSDEGLKKYTDTVTRYVRRAGLCGSVHWQKLVTETAGDVKIKSPNDKEGG